MKIVIIGGHFSPALSVIESLLASPQGGSKETKILFIGRKYTFEGDRAESLEYRTIKSLNISFANLITGRLQRKFTIYTIPSLLTTPYGLIQSFSILRSFKPDVVLGFGGYLSLPVIIAAFLLRIPIVIHEQTQEAGLANRIASNFADKICISWESSRKFFPKNKTILTGNPIRNFPSSIFHLPFSDRALPIIYITGGSSGSHFINKLAEGCMKQLLESYIVIHQTGNSHEYKDFEKLTKIRESLSKELRERYELKKFIDFSQVGSILNKADLIIGRAGINTVTELIHFGKPALLIPIPFSQKQEQLKNALFLKSLGLGEVEEQESLDANKFLQKIKEMVNNINKYKLDKSKIVIAKNAAHKIIEILEYVKKTKTN